MIKLKPSQLRFTGVIQKKTVTQNSNGMKVETWTDQHTGVPMSDTALSGREYIASEKIGSEIKGRITMYKLEPLDPSMRIIVNSRTYDIVAILPDPTDNVYVNIMVREGVSIG